jgi:hypothetical protein
MNKLHVLGLLALAYILDLALGLNGDGVTLAALSGFSGLATYDLGQNLGHIDLSDEIAAVLNADTMLLGRIPVKGQATQVDHYWLEESLNAATVQLNGALTAIATSMVVDSATGVQIGALLVDQTLGKQEVIQVTAISGTTLTVVRGFGDSAPAAETHADDALFRIIGRPKPEGDENVTDETVARSRKHNICQIFKSEVFISGTQKAVAMAGVPDEVAHQTAMRLLELRRQLGMSAYTSVKSSNSGQGGSDSVYRSMDGLRNFVRNNSGQLVTTSEALDETVVNYLAHLIYDQGAEPNFAVGSRDQMVAFSEMYKDKIRLAASDKQRGAYVTKFLTDLGVEIDLITDRWCLPGDLLMGDLSRVALVPLQGRAMQATPLDKRGDALRGMIVGEYTLEVRNAGQAFALHTGLQAR